MKTKWEKLRNEQDEKKRQKNESEFGSEKKDGVQYSVNSDYSNMPKVLKFYNIEIEPFVNEPNEFHKVSSHHLSGAYFLDNEWHFESKSYGDYPTSYIFRWGFSKIPIWLSEIVRNLVKNILNIFTFMTGPELPTMMGKPSNYKGFYEIHNPERVLKNG